MYDGRRAWAKTHIGERPLNKAEAHRVAHKLRDPKFYSVRTKRVDAEAVKKWKAEADRLRLRADTDTKVKAGWKNLFNERNRLWREEADRVGAVRLLLEKNGCDCDCAHDAESHDSDCALCLACRISWAIES